MAENYSTEIPGDDQNTQDTPEYREQMMAKAEGRTPETSEENPTNGGTSEDTGEEKLFAGKYKTEEDLVKGIAELAKHKYGGDLEAAYKAMEKGEVPPQKEEMASEDSEDSPEDGTGDDTKQKKSQESQTPTTEAEARATLNEAGLRFDDFAVEYAHTGELSDDSLKKLEDAGVSRDSVEAYIDNVRQTAEALSNTAIEIAGGDDQYREMLQWGVENFSDAERTAYDKMMTSGDLNMVKFAVNNLKSRYEQENGTPPKRTVEGNTAGRNVEVYSDWKEVTKDMRSEDYKTSEKFRKQVQEKLARSPI